MALPNDKRSLQDRLSRVATRMAQKFGNGTFTGVTAGAGASAGIPVSVLINRIAGKKVSLDNLGRENASALIFTLLDTANGATATQDQLVAQTYIASQMPTGIYGSPAALAMLAKLKAGVDSVDFHVLADSNGLQQSEGWVFGVARGLIQGCCASMYATPIFPTGYSAPSQVYGKGFRCEDITPIVGTNIRYASPNSGITLLDSRYTSPDDIKRYFNTTNAQVGFAQTWTTGAAYNATFFWTGLTTGQQISCNEVFYAAFPWENSGEKAYGIDTRKPLTYRVVHSVIPGHTGSSGASLLLSFMGASTSSSGYCGGAWNYQMTALYVGAQAGMTVYPPVSGSAANNFGGLRVSASSGLNGVTGITASKLTWPADNNRVGVTIGAAFSGWQPGFSHAYSPFAAYLESVHNNSKGWAVSAIACNSGYTSGGIASELVDFSVTTDDTQFSALRTVLEETRNRQIEAGGSGNLIVLLNSGINEAGSDGASETTAASVYKNHIETIVTKYKTIWDALGYPENDLAFIVTTTHPTWLIPELSGGVYDWNLDSLRENGKQYAETTPNYSNISPYSNVMFANLTQLGLYGVTQGGMTSGGNGFSNTNLYYIDGTQGSHLTIGQTGGYAYLGELLIKRCLRYSTTY